MNKMVLLALPVLIVDLWTIVQACHALRFPPQLQQAYSRVYAEDGQVFAWGYPANGRLGDFFDTGRNQVGAAADESPQPMSK